MLAPRGGIGAHRARRPSTTAGVRGEHSVERRGWMRQPCAAGAAPAVRSIAPYAVTEEASETFRTHECGTMVGWISAKLPQNRYEQPASKNGQNTQEPLACGWQKATLGSRL